MICEEFTDINSNCGGNAGGLLEVIYQNKDYVTITYDLEGEVTAITTAKRFRNIPMRRGRGNYADTSTIDIAGGVSVNSGTLTVQIPHRRKEVLRAIKRMAAGQPEIVIAYKDGNRRNWLLPYAYLTTKEGTTGNVLTDANQETIAFLQEGDFQEHGLEISEEIFNSLKDAIEPEITSINPNTGEGGDTVHLVGVGFTGATAVKFGATNATSFEVISDSVIHVVVPSLTAGTYEVTVTNAEGVSEGITFTAE